MALRCRRHEHDRATTSFCLSFGRFPSGVPLDPRFTQIEIGGTKVAGTRPLSHHTATECCETENECKTPDHERNPFKPLCQTTLPNHSAKPALNGANVPHDDKRGRAAIIHWAPPSYRKSLDLLPFSAHPAESWQSGQRTHRRLNSSHPVPHGRIPCQPRSK